MHYSGDGSACCCRMIIGKDAYGLYGGAVAISGRKVTRKKAASKNKGRDSDPFGSPASLTWWWRACGRDFLPADILHWIPNWC